MAKDVERRSKALRPNDKERRMAGRGIVGPLKELMEVGHQDG